MGNKTKNTLISVGVSLTPVAASMLGNGKLVAGGFLVVVCGALTIGYTYLDDKSKSNVTLPDGVDEDRFVDLAERLSELENEHNVSEKLNDALDNTVDSNGDK